MYAGLDDGDPFENRIKRINARVTLCAKQASGALTAGCGNERIIRVSRHRAWTREIEVGRNDKRAKTIIKR